MKKNKKKKKKRSSERIEDYYSPCQEPTNPREEWESIMYNYYEYCDGD